MKFGEGFGFIVGTLFGVALAAASVSSYYVGRTNMTNEFIANCELHRDILINRVVYGCSPQVQLDEDNPVVIKPGPEMPRWAKKR